VAINESSVPQVCARWIYYIKPGSPSLPKDKSKTPTVMLLEGRRLRLLNLHNLETITEASF
jgi:predicted phosphodiesterase